MLLLYQKFNYIMNNIWKFLINNKRNHSKMQNFLVQFNTKKIKLV